MSKIQLDISALLNVPLEKYGPDFTFIINGEEFKTSQLISDILSPSIYKIHLNDPTFDKIIIITKNSGHFSNILKLVNFKLDQIPDNEIPFFSEIFEILGIEYIKFENDKNIKITTDNVISLINNHLKFPKIFAKLLSNEIDFIASHFYEICEEQKEELIALDISILYKIINNDHLKLKNEDQLLKFVNDLYLNDVKYSIFYEAVYFKNVTSNSMIEFIGIFDYNDISNQTWQKLSMRLKEELRTNENDMKGRYNFPFENEAGSESTGKLFSMTNDQSFDGIINYLKKQSKNKIENEIDFTSSSYNDDSCTPINVSLFENKNKYFFSKDSLNSWICFHFKKHRVIPTHYTIRTYGSDCNSHPKSWVIEGSNDNSSWENIDTQNECPHLRKGWIVHSFEISKSISNSYQYIRMKQTGKSTNNDDRLLIDSFEIFGTLL